MDTPKQNPTTTCPGCHFRGTVTVRCDQDPHHSKLVCARCGRWLRWLAKPAPEPIVEDCRGGDQVLATLPRGRDAALKLTLSSYEGHPFVRLQLLERDGSGELRPASRGVGSIRIHEIECVTFALQRAASIVEQRAAPRPESTGDADRPTYVPPKRRRPDPGQLDPSDLAGPGDVVTEFSEF